jgi:3-isopropylmalate/(R)-2-methylmalate dehydratase small subunit
LTSEGRVWKFGDDVNTDLIIPGKYLDDYDPNHLASHAMEGVNAGFARTVKEGDILIAGRSFGCGSSREQAVTALVNCGIKTIIASSFARIFYRNAINLGMPVYESSEAYEAFNDGDMAWIDAEGGYLRSADGTKQASLGDIPRHLKEILDSGGLLSHIQRKMGQQ